MACQYDYFYILNNKENLIHFVNAEYEQFNNIPSYIIGLSEPFGLYFDGSDMHPSYCTH